MAAPILQAQVDINAPVSTVWNLVADLSKMPQWSPQCRLMKPIGGLRQGARTINVNRRGRLVWPTTCRITEYVPERKLAFRVYENHTVWSYELEPTEAGTRLVETRTAENGTTTSLSTFMVDKFMGGVPSFEQELIEGMNASLGRIKAAAER
jgi:uncharacterized protein YndB with AHSA1/START domain